MRQENNQEQKVKPNKYTEVSAYSPTKHGYFQYVVRPTRVVNGVVTTIQEEK